MERQGDEVHIETDEARGASTPNIVRWILAISLFAAIALLSLIWITGAATQSEEESYVSVPDPAADRSGLDATDSIVGEDADQLDTAAPNAAAAAPGSQPADASPTAGAPAN